MPEESYYEIDIKVQPINPKIGPTKPKGIRDPEPNPAGDLNTFSLDPELRETLHILSDYVILNKNWLEIGSNRTLELRLN